MLRSKGTHLGYNSDVNAPYPGPGATGGNESQRRPNQNFQEVVEDISGGNSIYNSLQVSMEKRFCQGFTVSANYTYGKSIDQVSYLTDLCGVNVINPYNVGAYRAVSDFNVPQRFVLNYLWQLPSPKEGVMRALLGGWETTAIWNWQSGFPLNITSNDDRSLTALGNDLADEVGPADLHQRTAGRPGSRSGSTRRRLPPRRSGPSAMPAAIFWSAPERSISTFRRTRRSSSASAGDCSIARSSSMR